jgi:hypothetical protein
MTSTSGLLTSVACISWRRSQRVVRTIMNMSAARERPQFATAGDKSARRFDLSGVQALPEHQGIRLEPSRRSERPPKGSLKLCTAVPAGPETKPISKALNSGFACKHVARRPARHSAKKQQYFTGPSIPDREK